jgi:hypothetical protein
MSKKALWERWKKTTIANQALVITGVLVFLSSGVYTITTIFQVRMWRENAKQTGEQSNRMIAASERMANTAQTQANTAASQANSIAEQSKTLKESLAETRKSVDAAQKQANTSEASAKAAQEGVRVAAQSMQYGDAAYLSLSNQSIEAFQIGQPAKAVIDFVNGGNSPAYDVHMAVQMGFRRKPIPPIPPLTAKERQESGSVVAPKGGLRKYATDQSVITEAELQAIKKEEVRLYVWGRLEYRDVFKRRRWLTFCLVHKMTTMLSLDNCGIHNDAN